jgi:superoxide reductase
MKESGSHGQQTGKAMVGKAIAEFNKYRSPEATARLVSLKGNLLEVEFAGHFCRTCGFYDYFEDFVIALNDSGVNAGIAEIKETGNGAVVAFKIAGGRETI